MGKRSYKSFTADQKLAIIKEHLVDRLGVPEVCEKHGIKPSVYYSWQKLLFENGPGFERKTSTHTENVKLSRVTAQLETLEHRVREKDSVLAELMCEHLKLKKTIHGGN